MAIRKITNGVFHIRSKDQYAIASTFMRMQEFYESPLRGIRNKYFTVEHIMDLYAEEYGNFTYYSDWVGFNVPGNIVGRFFKVFKKDLLVKEKMLYEEIKHLIKSKERFYLIGTYQSGAVLDHELAHAFYYLSADYKKEMNAVTSTLPPKVKKELMQVLIDKGYCKQVRLDELQAYCSTSSMIELTKFFGKVNIPWDVILEYKKVFADHKDEKLGEKSE